MKLGTYYEVHRYVQRDTKYIEGYVRFIVYKKEVFDGTVTKLVPQRGCKDISVNKNNGRVYRRTRSLDKKYYADGSRWDMLRDVYPDELWTSTNTSCKTLISKKLQKRIERSKTRIQKPHQR